MNKGLKWDKNQHTQNVTKDRNKIPWPALSPEKGQAASIISISACDLQLGTVLHPGVWAEAREWQTPDSRGISTLKLTASHS